MLLNSLFTPNFFRIGNLNNVITQLCPTILCGMGMTLVISTGGIDISVGSVMALAGVLTARLMPETGLPAAVLAAVAVSVVVGLLYRNYGRQAQITGNGYHAGTDAGAEGVAQVLCRRPRHLFQQAGGSGKTAIPLGNLQTGGVIPVQIIPIVLSVAAVWVMIEKTVLGRQIQAVGDNLRFSSLAGINTARTLMIVYGLSTFLQHLPGFSRRRRYRSQREAPWDSLRSWMPLRRSS